jgi:integrase-like protein
MYRANLAQSADTPETANRLRGRIESILDWATVRGYREGEKTVCVTAFLPTRIRRSGTAGKMTGRFHLLKKLTRRAASARKPSYALSDSIGSSLHRNASARSLHGWLVEEYAQGDCLSAT